jgi:hypothetical protein
LLLILDTFEYMLNHNAVNVYLQVLKGLSYLREKHQIIHRGKLVFKIMITIITLCFDFFFKLKENVFDNP